MTQIEAAAIEEMAMLCRDAAIARCFGLTPAHLTQKRKTNKARWDAFERRWLTDGAALLRATQKRQAVRETARQRRMREALCQQQTREILCRKQTREASRQQRLQREEDLAWERRLSAEREKQERARKPFSVRLLRTISADALGWTLLVGAAAYFAFGLIYPGGWTGAWADWTGVGR